MDNGLSIFIEFEMLFDEDYGLIRTLVNKFKNSQYLNTEYLKHVSFKNLINDLLSQEVRDPLKLAIADGINYQSIYDDIERDDNFKELIVKNSYPLKKMISCMKYSKALSLDDSYSVTVCCNNKYEVERLKDIGFKVNTIMYETGLDLSSYDCLYIKEGVHLKSKYKNVSQKHIYIANYNYNCDSNKDLLPKNEIIAYSIDSDLKIIDIY